MPRGWTDHYALGIACIVIGLVLIAWIEGRLEVTRERIVEQCAGLFVAAAGVATS